MEIARPSLLKSLLTTDDLDRMNPRKLVLMVMAWSPIMLTAGLGVFSRGSSDPYEAASGVSLHARVLAYAPVVKDAQEARLDEKDSETAVRIAKAWLAQVDRGTLTVLEPAFFDDTMQEGVKSQISEAAYRITNTLIDSARKRDSDEASASRTAKLVLALRLTESLKYSDFPTVYQANRDQVRAFHVLEKLAPTLDEAEREKLTQELESFRTDERRLDGLTLLMRRHYADSIRRRGLEPITIQESQRNVTLTSQMKSGEGPSMRVISTQYFASNDEAPKFLTEFKLAWASVRTHTKALDSALGALQTPAP